MIHIIPRACKSFYGFGIEFSKNLITYPKDIHPSLGMVFGQVFQTMGHCTTLNTMYYITCVFEVVYLQLVKRQKLLKPKWKIYL